MEQPRGLFRPRQSSRLTPIVCSVKYNVNISKQSGREVRVWSRHEVVNRRHGSVFATSFGGLSQTALTAAPRRCGSCRSSSGCYHSGTGWDAPHEPGEVGNGAFGGDSMR